MKILSLIVMVCAMLIACNNESTRESSIPDSSTISTSVDTSGTTNSNINNSMDTLHKSDSVRKDSARKPR